jgi:hypothetical protein
MKRSSAALALGLVGLTLVASWCTLGPRRERVAVALLDDVSVATQLPSDQQVVAVDLGGESRRALVTRTAERVIWPVTVPPDAWLRVSFGMLPEAVATEGDGSLFMIGAWDRGWHDIAIDLSKYAGQTLELRFLFRSRDSTTGDAPALGDPRIVVR